VLANGKRVTDAKTWTDKRRPEIVGSEFLLGGHLLPVGFLSYQKAFQNAFKIRSQRTARNIPGANGTYDSASGFYSPGLAASSPNFATAGLADAGTRLKADFQSSSFFPAR
jgi:hypothetical protein